MILLITGGRDFADYAKFEWAMDNLPERPEIVIHGDARGADRMAIPYCKSRGIHWAAVPALWDFFRTQPGGVGQAGTKRNGAMLLLKPTYCLAMPGGSGTGNMKKQCQEMGVPVWAPFG